MPSWRLGFPEINRVQSSMIKWQAKQLIGNHGSRQVLSLRDLRPVIVIEELEVSGLEYNQLGKEEKAYLLREY